MKKQKTNETCKVRAAEKRMPPTRDARWRQPTEYECSIGLSPIFVDCSSNIGRFLPMPRKTEKQLNQRRATKRELIARSADYKQTKTPDKAKPEPDRQRLSPVARSAEYNNTNNAARLMMTHDGDDEQGHPGHLLWVSLHQAAEHSFPAPHRRRRRHHHVTMHRLAAVLPPMTARWEPPPSMPSVRPPARRDTPDQRMR